MAILKLNLSGHENKEMESMGFAFPAALQVDLADPELPNKLVVFLKDQGVNGNTIVHLAPPGLAPLAVMIIAAIHGLTGSFPVMYPMIRGSEGFSVGEPFDLTEYRNSVARTSREGVVKL